MFSSILLISLAGLALGNVLPEVTKDVKLLQVGLANDEFEAHLLQSLEQHSAGKNVFISGFSVSTVMAMLMAGAKEKTYEEIYNSLGFSKSHFTNEDILAGYKQLLHSLNHPEKNAKNILSVANSLAVQKNRPILDAYLESAIGNFDAQIMVKDFVHEGKKATDEINGWVKEKTHQKIPKLIDSPLSPSTVMVLLNAIYFKGTWQNTFDAKHTQPAPFHVTRDATSQAQLMNSHSHLKYAHFADGQLVEIPYANHTMSMYVFLPHDSHAPQGISHFLATETLSQRIAKLHSTEVILQLPKFKFEGSYSLAATLKQLGMRAAFVPGGADLSNIDGARDLYVSEVVHKTFIEVNEEGSEAAAATGVIIKHWASIHPPPRPVVFKVDRPFAFAIRDNRNQLNLFSGVINKP